MTKEKAIEILKLYKQRLEESVSTELGNDIQAFEMAISELENNYNFLISKQDLLKATVNKNSIWNKITDSNGNNLEEIIEKLPTYSAKEDTAEWIVDEYIDENKRRYRMKLTINPNNRKYYSEEFIKGFECGVERQYEEDMKKDTIRPIRIEGDTKYKTQPMVFFTDRIMLADEYRKWIAENNIKDTPESVIAFVQNLFDMKKFTEWKRKMKGDNQ